MKNNSYPLVACVSLTLVAVVAFAHDNIVPTSSSNRGPVVIEGVYPNCAPPSKGNQRPIVAAFNWLQEEIDLLIDTWRPGEIVVLDYSSTDPRRCSYMRKLHAAEMHVGGYVNTGSGKRSEDLVRQDIDHWFTDCPTDTPEWIFGDVGLSDATDIHYAVYQRYQDYVHSYAACFMLNEGGALFDTGERVMALADVILWYEDTCQRLGIPNPTTRTEHPPAWLGNYPPEQQAMTIVECHPDMDNPTHSSEMVSAVAISQFLGAGYVYVYDGQTTSYGHIPPYWSDEVVEITAGLLTYPRLPIEFFTDRFDGTEIDPTLWWCSPPPGGTCREEGSLVLSLDPGPTGRVFVMSHDFWSLTDSAAFVEVPEVVDGQGANNMFVLTLSDQLNHMYILQWWYEMGSDLRQRLFANYWVDGQINNVATLNYDPIAHRWWRFLEKNGVVTFDTSSNGQDWIERGRVEDPFRLGSLYVRFSANGFGPGAHGQARYTKFNVAPSENGGEAGR